MARSSPPISARLRPEAAHSSLARPAFIASSSLNVMIASRWSWLAETVFLTFEASIRTRPGVFMTSRQVRRGVVPLEPFEHCRVLRQAVDGCKPAHGGASFRSFKWLT